MLSQADLQAEQSVGLEQCVRLRDEPPINVEAIARRKECRRGLEVSDLRVKVLSFREGHIRRVRDDCVERPFMSQRLQEVGLNKADATGDPVVRRILRGQFERGR